jgi:Xaa-Pro aminopeptidase
MMTETLTEDQLLRRELAAEKHAQAKALLREKGIDCWLTFTREGSDLLLPFLIGGEYIVAVTSLLIFAEGPSVAIVADYDTGQVEGLFDEVIPYSRDWKEPLLSVLRDRDPGTIGLNYSSEDHGVDGLTHGLFRLLSDAVVPLGIADRFVSAAAVASTIRSIKSPSEIERIRRACEITQRIFDDVTEMAKPGLTEIEIAEIIKERMETYGVEPSWEPAFCPSVFGSMTKGGHALPGTAKIERGDGFRVDFGVKYEGYAADLQRTWYFLKPGETAAPADYQHAFDAVKDGIALAASLIKPGIAATEVDRQVRELIGARGYSFTHALGHQVGRMAHDGGTLMGPMNERYGSRSRGNLEAGMVLAVEPCIANVAIEENVVVTADGCEYLVSPQESISLL